MGVHWLITGASRGIGLALTKQLLSEGEKVTVGVRTSMPFQHQNLTVLNVEMSSPSSIEKFVEGIADAVDVLINNAGILIKEKFPYISEENLVKTYRVNVVGPYMLVQECYKKGLLREGTKIVNVSSILGSISTTTGTMSISYSISKAALNMVTKLLAHRLKNMFVISMHPGWVRTDMGGPDAPISVEDSAAGILKVVRGLNQTGVFLNYEGEPLPW
ncbi:SDR family oxidoreductase [Pseudothermotoga sp.]